MYTQLLPLKKEVEKVGLLLKFPRAAQRKQSPNWRKFAQSGRLDWYRERFGFWTDLPVNLARPAAAVFWTCSF
jgi:hypothetical protein